MHWVDRLTEGLAPRWTLRRMRARAAAEILARHYEAAAAGRRTQGWHRSAGDANAAISGGLSLREHARDLVRNNPHASSALDTIVDHTVGWGIVGAPEKASASRAAINVAADRWKAWAESTACDADGRQNFYGLTGQVDRTVVESGECLIRRRWRRPEDNLPLPVQLQVLEPDYLDVSRDGFGTPGNGRVIQGIEFDTIGRRVAYWLFPEHPGSNLAGAGFGASRRIPASEVLHVFKPGRPGQVRAASWFAPVLLRMKDFDEYEDAALVKQKIAACLAVITSDVDGSAPALGGTDPARPDLDFLEPGMILTAPPGRSVSVVQPPTISEHDSYSRVTLRTIAAGLGITYEDLTGDYVGMPFSAARMSRLRHWARVYCWRWNMLIPQFCDPVWGWAMQAAQVMNLLQEAPTAQWTAPPAPMIEPDREGIALQRLLRIGALTWPEMVRERGSDPETVLAEIAEWNTKFDAVGVVLDSDPRKVSQQGQPAEQTTTPARPGSDEDDEAAPGRHARNGHRR